MPHRQKARHSGFSSPSIVGISSETVGSMCIARCKTVYGALAYVQDAVNGLVTARTQDRTFIDFAE